MSSKNPPCCCWRWWLGDDHSAVDTSEEGQGQRSYDWMLPNKGQNKGMGEEACPYLTQASPLSLVLIPVPLFPGNPKLFWDAIRLFSFSAWPGGGRLGIVTSPETPSAHKGNGRTWERRGSRWTWGPVHFQTASQTEHLYHYERRERKLV